MTIGYCASLPLPSPALSLPPSSPSLSIFTAQVILVFIIQLHDDHWVLSHTELWAASYSLLQEREVASSVSPAQVEALQGEGVPIANKGDSKYVNLVVQYEIAIHIYASKKFWRILIWWLLKQTAKLPNFLAIRYKKNLPFIPGR